MLSDADAVYRKFRADLEIEFLMYGSVFVTRDWTGLPVIRSNADYDISIAPKPGTVVPQAPQLLGLSPLAAVLEDIACPD